MSRDLPSYTQKEILAAIARNIIDSNPHLSDEDYEILSNVSNESYILEE